MINGIGKMNSAGVLTKRTGMLAAAVFAVLGAFGVLFAVTAGPADAQQSNQKVTNVGLGHNLSWHLLVVWDEPAAGIPRDYRVMWAKSSENYKTWTDESGNAFPTTNSHSVMDVERGVEYKVKVRARYSSGSGPWSDEVRYTVPAEVAPTATPTATPEPTPEPVDNTPHWVSSTMPEYVAMFDWSVVDDAVGYDVQVHRGNPDEWVDLTDPSVDVGVRGWVMGSSVIVGSGYNHERVVRVRGVFGDGTTTDWYSITVRPE